MGPADSEILTREECFELLHRASTGRVGISIDALPVILPVHFGLFGESVLFRTVPGSKLDAAIIGSVVAFQADAWEPSSGTHWSVLLQGIVSEVGSQADAPRARAIAIKSWRGMQPDQRLVSLNATNATGRRFHLAGERSILEPSDPSELPESPIR